MLSKLIYTFCRKPEKLYQEVVVDDIIHSIEYITAGDFSIVNFGESTTTKASLKRILYFYKGIGFACVDIDKEEILLYNEKWYGIVKESFPMYKIVY